MAIVAEIRPIRKVTQMASRSCSLRNSEAYQRVEKPPQTVAMREALNEYTATERIGTYRKA